MRAAILLCMLAACDPVWGVDVRVRHPAQMPLEDATVAVACPESRLTGAGQMAIRTSRSGKAQLAAIGSVWPIGCDVYIAKPGYVTQRIRYHDLCPAGPDNCDRWFTFDLVLEPE
jgi:hypothetical protein